MYRRLAKFAIGAVIVAVMVAGGWSMIGTTQAAGACLCPDIYAPVKCSNGKTYPNLCTASCQKAKNCVPTGDI